MTTAAILLSVFSSLFQFIMSNVVGYVIEGMGYGFTYRTIAGIVLVSTIGYFIILQIKARKERKIAEENANFNKKDC